MKKVHAKIEEAKTKLGLSSRALSVRIGHHASYLSQIRVLSTEKQERLIRELNAAISGEKVKSDTQIILGLVDELKDAKSDTDNLNKKCSGLIYDKYKLGKIIDDLTAENKGIRQDRDRAEQEFEKADGKNRELRVIISDLEAYKKQAAFDLTEAHKSINDLKERLESYRKDNSLLLKQLEAAQENFAAANLNSQLLEKKLASKEQILDDYYKDLDDLEFDLNEKQSQLDQSIENNKALAEYLDILDCQVKRFGAYIFLLIVTLSITLIAFLIYMQSH